MLALGPSLAKLAGRRKHRNRSTLFSALEGRPKNRPWRVRLGPAWLVDTALSPRWFWPRKFPRRLENSSQPFATPGVGSHSSKCMIFASRQRPGEAVSSEPIFEPGTAPSQNPSANRQPRRGPRLLDSPLFTAVPKTPPISPEIPETPPSTASRPSGSLLSEAQATSEITETLS